LNPNAEEPKGKWVFVQDGETKSPLEILKMEEIVESPGG
jgi:hypothetical protein